MLLDKEIDLILKEFENLIIVFKQIHKYLHIIVFLEMNHIINNGLWLINYNLHLKTSLIII